MCCQENDKSSPSSHLFRIFSSTHYCPLFLSRSASSFSPPSCSLFLAFSAASSQYFIFPLLPSFLQLFLSSLMTFFVPFLPPSSSHPLSSPPSPIPHPQTFTLRCLLIFLPPPTHTHHHHLPHYVHTIYLSVTLFFCFPCVSSSMSSPRCVVIVARLATAATADSRAVGTNRGRAGRGMGGVMMVERGDVKMKETLIHGRVGGGGYFFC